MASVRKDMFIRASALSGAAGGCADDGTPRLRPPKSNPSGDATPPFPPWSSTLCFTHFNENLQMTPWTETMLQASEETRTSFGYPLPPPPSAQLLAEAVVGAALRSTRKEDNLGDTLKSDLAQCGYVISSSLHAKQQSRRDMGYKIKQAADSQILQMQQQTCLVSFGDTHLGVQGHPKACGPPCKYIKRKGGCRDGSSCPNCHLCFWRKDIGDEVAKAPNVKPSRVEPSTERLGLYDGEPCFLPLLARASLPPKGTLDCNHAVQPINFLDVVPITVAASSAHPSLAEANNGWQSVGSIGHPHTCRKGCKYHNKPRGCKDGKLCVRCHACPWMRYIETKP